MPAVKFEISNQNITNNPKYVTFSQNEKYHTVRTDENGRKTFDGFCSGYQIENGEISGIPSSDLRAWCDAVEEFLYDHNDNVYNGKGFDIKFNILDHDSRMAFKYEEYSNGKLVRTGIGWSKDFETEAERESWIEAVNKYKKDHGIKTPFDKIKDIMGSTSNAIDSLDLELPTNMIQEIPNIANAIPKVTGDPCEFMSEVKRAAMTAAGMIAGIPTPKDLYNYGVKISKNNIVADTIRKYDEQSVTVRDLYEPMTREMMGTEEYFAEVDALWEEIGKEYDDSVCLFETVVEPPFVYKPPVFSYNNLGGEGEDSGDKLQNNVNLSGISQYTPSPYDNMWNYKEVTLDAIYYAGNPPGGRFTPNINMGDISRDHARNNILAMMRNLLIPLRKAWEEYCRKQLNNTTPRWTFTSGYRPYEKNKMAGGVADSPHRWGYAVDVRPELLNGESLNQKVRTLGNFIARYVTQYNLAYDQILFETSGSTGRMWLHIGYGRMKYSNGITQELPQRRQPAKHIMGA